MAVRIERRCAQVTNESALPQRIGFTAPNSVTVPREIAVSPLHGFAHLLPAESKTFTVTFSPEIAADFASAIVIKNELGHIQRIGLSAKVSRCFRVGFFGAWGRCRVLLCVPARADVGTVRTRLCALVEAGKVCRSAGRAYLRLRSDSCASVTWPRLDR